jgi:hypothetical protein
MAIMIQVAGVERTDFVDGAADVRWEDHLDGRGQLSLRFSDVVGGFVPLDGQEILVLEDGVRRFGGMLLEPEETATPANDRLVFSCRAAEFSSICDRHLIAKAYTNQTLKAIVLDIVTQEMSDEGISTTGVETGPTIQKAVFNWISVTQAFNELAELTGTVWRIDANKVLQFRDRTSIAAPAPLDSLTVTNGTLRIRPDRQHYRNRQVLRAGTGLTSTRVERFAGDSERRTFNTAFKVGEAPTITVNAVSKTVGIRQVDTGKDWYWSKGAAEISQDTGGTVLTASDDLEVTYKGLFPIIISAAKGSEVSARQAIEGGSGRYSRVEERTNIDSVDAAIAAVQAILDRYGSIGRVIDCETREPGYAPGQLVPMDFPVHGIDEDFLIEAVTAFVPAGLTEIRYGIRAISGDPYGGWQEYFRRILKIGRQFVINENEVVVGLTLLADSATVSDSLSSPSAAPERQVGVALVDFSAVRAA